MPPKCKPYEPAALVDVLPAHGLEGVGAADEEAVGVVAVLLDHAQVVLALADFLALQIYARSQVTQSPTQIQGRAKKSC